MDTPLRVLIASTPVGPLGSGIGGGVELTLHSLVYGLGHCGHHVEVVAPEGSLHVGVRVHQIAGALQESSQMQSRDVDVIMPRSSVLAAMWQFVASNQADFDVVVNLAYDWLPFYLTEFVDIPVVHLVSMGSLSDQMDDAIERVARSRPGRLAVHSRAQAATFPTPAAFRVVGNAIIPDRYDVRLQPDEPPTLGFVGRISPEKGLEDVAALSERTGLPVRVWGFMQDEAYWNQVIADHPLAHMEYRGFLPTDDLQAEIGGCLALVMTPKWVEAFGNVAIEAMATGVPVLCYDRGGPAETVIDGVTGFVVAADDIDALVAATNCITTIDRVACRQHVEETFATEALGERISQWLTEVVQGGIVGGGDRAPYPFTVPRATDRDQQTAS